MSDGYTILSLDEAQTAAHRDCTLIPVRHHLGFRAAGVNAWKADSGDQLVPPHSEDPGMEELYVVVCGRATFTVDEETTNAPPGSLIFVPPGVHRRAEAAEDGTVVFVIGGAVGRAFESSGWGNAITANLAAEDIDLWYVHYDAGCYEVSARHSDAALEHLRRAKQLDGEGESGAYFREDSRLDPLRDDPRFQELLA